MIQSCLVLSWRRAQDGSRSWGWNSGFPLPDTHRAGSRGIKHLSRVLKQIDCSLRSQRLNFSLLLAQAEAQLPGLSFAAALHGLSPCVCELCPAVSMALSPLSAAQRAQGCCSITPALPALGGLWGALLYVTKRGTTSKAHPCKCHSWPSNVHLEGTDLSPSPNSFLVSSVQGRHELEKIMVSRKS